MKQLFIFEMANNHQGSIEHAKLIVDEFAKVAKEAASAYELS